MPATWWDPHHRYLNNGKEEREGNQAPIKVQEGTEQGGMNCPWVGPGGLHGSGSWSVSSLFAFGHVLFCLENPSSTPTIFLLWVNFWSSRIHTDLTGCPRWPAPCPCGVLRSPVQTSFQGHHTEMMLPPPPPHPNIHPPLRRLLLFCLLMFSQIPLCATSSQAALPVANRMPN